MNKKLSPYRLAIREDGATLCAYFAEHGTMENAKLLMTMSAAIAHAHKPAFDAFKAAALEAFRFMHTASGMPDFEEAKERPAPPVEKGKGSPP
jgi:hypothetical protein